MFSLIPKKDFKVTFRKATGHFKVNPGRVMASNIYKRWNFTRKLGEDCSRAEYSVALSFLAAEAKRE